MWNVEPKIGNKCISKEVSEQQMKKVFMKALFVYPKPFFARSLKDSIQEVIYVDHGNS